MGGSIMDGINNNSASGINSYEKIAAFKKHYVMKRTHIMSKILVFGVAALVLLLLPIIAYLFEWITKSALFTALGIFMVANLLGFFVKWDRRSNKIEDLEQQEESDKSGLH